jgi:hypothetical protein
VIIVGIGGCRGELVDDEDETIVVGGDVKAIDGIYVIPAVVVLVVVDIEEIQLFIDVIHSFISISSLA